MTDFSGMSHEQMLAWVDEASSFYVQSAADKLSMAAGELRDIAQQLQFRPERVEWKGEAFQEFKDWGAGLASATYRLADYSENASKWMSQASEAIAVAQSAIPRYASHAQAKENLEAAHQYHNDPDAGRVAQNARASMATSEDAKAIALKEEANRQAAVDEMVKLSQAYQQSKTQMERVEVPVLPPPPGAFVPEGMDARGDSGYIQPSATSDSGTVGGSGGGATRSQDSGSTAEVGRSNAGGVVHPEQPVGLGIDSVGTLPPPTTTPQVSSASQPPVAKPDSGLVPPVGITPGVARPTTGGPPVGRGTSVGPRSPLLPSGRSGLGVGGPLGTMPRDGGITGGRPVPPSTGRPVAGIPRGTVIGAEGGTGRGPMGHGGGIGGGIGGGSMGAGQSGVSGGRRLAMETGGIVGGRPQQVGAVSARPFTPGGSGLVRGVAPGGASRGGAGPMGRGGARPADTRGTDSRREDGYGERPDYLVEDEETWQQGSRRVAPPVID
ncbi:WXG100 family type VII secretion target [Streptomyces sp. NPDC059909]|uniref:WXG100 family type VII secretion target n=1 Tax=Streptomyces sp. NPDC059909 TaxID=3346998 RepID=UPI00365D897E